MDAGIDPEYFGCGNKVEYFETLDLAKLGGLQTRGDFSQLGDLESGVLSVDRVYQCSSNPRVFAAIAINHVINDIIVGFSNPRQVAIAFEFAESVDHSGKMGLVSAFRDELDARGIELGKCHSSIGALTSVTIAVVGDDASVSRPKPRTGSVVLGRALGHFKMHYLAETGQISEASAATHLLSEPFAVSSKYAECSDLSDVSGHGLVGTLHSMAVRNRIDMEIVLDSSLAAHPNVLDMPTPCLLNDFDAFAGRGIAIDIDCWRLAGLRETAGPLVSLVNSDIDTVIADAEWPAVIGNFCDGRGQISITWKD